MNHTIEKTTIGDLVAADFRVAGIFEAFGIDFCCDGRRSVAEACAQAAVDPAALERALADLSPVAGQDEAIAHKSVGQLIDYILVTHHDYVRRSLPTIAAHLAKLVKIHGARHPELTPTALAFDQVGRELLQHMTKEERILFPYIRELASARKAPAQSPFGSIENPIRMMEREHREAGDDLRRIRDLTNGYVPPVDGCSTYRVCLAELDAFERDLHRHVHLENHVLFPQAIELERSACGR